MIYVVTYPKTLISIRARQGSKLAAEGIAFLGDIFFSPIFFSRRKELIGCSCPILYFSIRHPSLIGALNGEINERVLPCGCVILFRWQKNRADHVNTYLRLVLECQDVETKAATGTMNFVDRRLRACGFNFIAVGRVHCAIGSYVRGNSGR